MSEEKKIIIDEDWKAQVEAEKQAAAEKSAAEQAPPEPPTSGEPSTSVGGGAAPGAGAPGSGEVGADTDDPPMPPASIGMLMSSLATEALMAMGQMPHPATGETIVRRNLAKYLIDTLEVLRDKTAGNLSSEEANALDDVLHQLRMAFVSGR